MIELAVAQGVTLLGKISYDVWKRWFEGRTPGAAMVAHGSTSYTTDPESMLSMIPRSGRSATPALLTVTLHPGDDLSLEHVFQEHPVLLVISDRDHSVLDGFVIPGQVADVHEVLLPPGTYDVSAFVFDDDSLTVISGAGWEQGLSLDPGSEVGLSLAIQVVVDEIAGALFGDTFGTIVFETGDAFDLLGPMVSLGRNASCDVAIDDNVLSREHALLGLTPEGWAIEDLTSLNGTYVNGRRVTRSHLHDDDIVTIGNTRFQVHT